MPINRFRGDALARPKIIRLLGPGGSGVVQAEITCGTRLFTFAEWNAAAIVAALSASTAPEFANLAFAVDGQDVVVTGPEDDDFIIGLRYRPTVTITNELGVTAVNQQTALAFNGARAGTYTLTINGLTTGSITYGDDVDLIAEIDALSGWTSGDAIVASSTPNQVILEFKGTLAGVPVAVSMDASNLHNGSTLTVEQVSPYRPEPHDVWYLSLSESTTCDVTIDGETATIRSDEPLAVIRQKLQALSSRTLNVYGGFGGTDVGGIGSQFFILDFAGWTVSTRPTITASVSDGAYRLNMITNPTDGVFVNDAAGQSGSLGLVSHWLLDFTGGSIIIEYDGREVTLDRTMTKLQVRDAIWDVSEYDEANTGNEGYSGSTTGGWVAPTGAGSIISSVDIMHLLNVNDSIRQVGGDGQLVRLNHEGSAAAGAIHRIFTPARTNGGTFRLILQEGVTGSLSGTISDTDLETALQTLVASVTVAGAGTPADPWVLTYDAADGPRPLEIPSDVALAGNGTGSAATVRESVVARNQRARISISTNAVSGTYRVAYGTQGPVTLTLGDSAGTVDGILASMPGIGNTSNIDTSFDAASNSYLIVFASALANQQLPLFSLIQNNLAVISTTTITVTQQASGPGNFAEPANWSLGRVPHAEDTVVIESSVGDIKYGLRQWVSVTADTGTEKLTAASGHDLRPGQVVRFLTAGTLPTGISSGTDYYVIDPDNEAGTFRVSSTANGTAVNITGAGSGAIFCGLLAADIRVNSSFTDQLGRDERTGLNAAEYLPRYLQVGLASGGICEIGGGNSGRGSNLLRLDFGYSLGSIVIIRTDSTGEADRPACSVLAASGSLSVSLINGDLGIAAFEPESSVVGVIAQNSGTLFCGDVAAVTLTKNGGRLLSRTLVVSGPVEIRG